MQDSERLKEALLKRALGYDFEEKEITADRNGRPEKVRIVKKQMPPDINAIMCVRQMIKKGIW